MAAGNVEAGDGEAGDEVAAEAVSDHGAQLVGGGGIGSGPGAQWAVVHAALSLAEKLRRRHPDRLRLEAPGERGDRWVERIENDGPMQRELGSDRRRVCQERYRVLGY